MFFFLTFEKVFILLMLQKKTALKVLYNFVIVVSIPNFLYLLYFELLI